MRADAQTIRAQGVKKPKLRYLDLSFEGKGEVDSDKPLGSGYTGDNGKLPHGGYKGTKKHPLSIYSFDKGREYQQQVRQHLDRMLEGDVLEVHGSPTWALEAHRQPTHSGESPLLANRFMSASKYEVVNGTGRWAKNVLKPNRCSAPPAHNGVLYYRPNRTHQYLTATELRDASEGDDALKYGRPTRTTLLRARQRAGSASSNAYELRRQLVQRMEEMKNTSVISHQKEFMQQHSDIDGESLHSFLTGARYNRAHCLDSKSLTQYGVYMPRNNPLGCFVIGHRDMMETTSAPPDSPRSDVDEGSAPVVTPKRPTTAPGYGRKRTIPVPHTPRQAWGDTSAHANGDVHSRRTDDDRSRHVVEEVMIWGPGLNVKGMRLPLAMAREGPARVESRLPSVHGTSLSKLRQLTEHAENNSDANQPPPSPVPTSARDDNPLPLVKPEVLADRKPDEDEAKPKPDSKNETRKQKPPQMDRSVNVPSVSGPGSVAVAKDVGKEGEVQNEAVQNGGTQEAAADDSKEAAGKTEEVEETQQEKEMERKAETEGESEVADATGGESAEPKDASSAVANDQAGETPANAAGDQASESAKEGAPAAGSREAETTIDQSATEDAGKEAEETPAGDEQTTEAAEGAQTTEEQTEKEKEEEEGQKEEKDDSPKFFLTEEGAESAPNPDAVSTNNQRIIGDDVIDFKPADTQPDQVQEDDRASTSSKGSKKSKGKRNVTFSDDYVEHKTDDVKEKEGTENSDVKKSDNVNQSENGHTNDVDDNEVEDNDLDLGEGQVEPLKVIVTHIDKSSVDGSSVSEKSTADPTSNSDGGEKTTDAL